MKNEQFDRIIGYETIKNELMQICDIIKNPDVYQNLGAKLPHGVLLNGGDVTLKALRALPRETQQDILDYLRECPLYEAVTAGGRDYILVHSGFDNFSKERKISDYSSDEFIWAEPEITDEYFDDIHTVFGHTPTGFMAEEYEGQIIKTRTWTDIDCGASAGKEPILLRLDDYKEFKL